MLKNWNCIVVTCPTRSLVNSTREEIDFLKKKGRISENVAVLTVEDPAENIGSGAATLNALLVATEFLSSLEDFEVITSDVLYQARILILHNGRNYPYNVTGKAFIPLPLEYLPANSSDKTFASGIVSNLESLLLLIDKLAVGSPKGVWVCSTDMMILQEQLVISIDWENIADVVMFCVPSDLRYAAGHGVVAIDEKGYISNIYYCRPEDEIKELAQDNGKVPLVSGVVFLSKHVAMSLLSFHVLTPLDSYTYLGLDSGADPLQASLFFDILIAMCSENSKESFVNGNCAITYNLKVGIKQSCSKKSCLARSLIWEELSQYKMSPIILSGCQHLYWSALDGPRRHLENLFRIAKSENVHCMLCQKKNVHISRQSITVNSFFNLSQASEIAPRSVVYNSVFEIDSLHIGENSFISDVAIDNLSELSIPANFVVINAFTKCPESTFVLVFGTDEKLTEFVDVTIGTFCGRPWEDHFKYLSITENDLWPDLDIEKKTLMNAKLFIPNMSLKDTFRQFQVDGQNSEINLVCQKFKSSKRYSLNEVIIAIDFSRMFAFRRSVYAKISIEMIKKILINNEHVPILPYIRAAIAEEWHFKVMDTIDEILMSEANPVVITRALSNMADLLGAMAGQRGGLRSGPGNHPAWQYGFALLKIGKIHEGVQKLIAERSKWLDSPDHLMRAARHYERAAQILIQRSVNTVIQSFNLKTVPLIEIGTFVTAECPARIDLQGGWSDTPPICYELSGSVVNVAILIDGVKPIGAKACRLKEPSIILKLGLGDWYPEITITHMKDILDYDQPYAKGALLKAALICADIVDVNSDISLSEQLLSRFGGGFFIQSWSQLPQGCGLGTSSILAGAILSVLWTVSGRTFDKSSVVHAVLYVEQLLTTGGGWQDQVSGIFGGIQRGYSEASLPLVVKTEAIILSPEIVNRLNAHLLLIYTGKVRLARNILQNVIRNWYAQEEVLVTCFKNLILHSHKMKEALQNGDLQEIGILMNEYWKQKKLLAHGCEPLAVQHMMKELEPICCGQMLVGAGGGGFMCILTKDPHAKEHVKNILHKTKENEKVFVHTVTVDMSGLEVKVL